MIVVLEGPDGVGKTTVAQELRSQLELEGILCGIVYQPNGWNDLSKEDKSTAEKGVLICDREKYYTQKVYTKALPQYKWNFPLERDLQKVIPPVDSGIKVFRVLLETENGWPLKDVEYSLSDYSRIFNEYHYLPWIERFSLAGVSPFDAVAVIKYGFVRGLFSENCIKRYIERENNECL